MWRGEEVESYLGNIEELSQGDIASLLFIMRKHLKEDILSDTKEISMLLSENSSNSELIKEIINYLKDLKGVSPSIKYPCNICKGEFSDDPTVHCANGKCPNSVHEGCYGVLPNFKENNKWYCYSVRFIIFISALKKIYLGVKYATEREDYSNLQMTGDGHMFYVPYTHQVKSY